jgi:hypothetical protein
MEVRVKSGSDLKYGIILQCLRKFAEAKRQVLPTFTTLKLKLGRDHACFSFTSLEGVHFASLIAPAPTYQLVENAAIHSYVPEQLAADGVTTANCDKR